MEVETDEPPASGGAIRYARIGTAALAAMSAIMATQASNVEPAAAAGASGCTVIGAGRSDCVSTNPGVLAGLISEPLYVAEADYDMFTNYVCNYEAKFWGSLKDKNGNTVTWYSGARTSCSFGGLIHVDSPAINSYFGPNTLFCGAARDHPDTLELARWKTVFPCVWIEP
jgi:hypothetical protein